MILEPSTTSDSLTVATTSVIAAPALLHSLTLNPGSAASSVILYDNASAGSGTVLAQLLGVANGASITICFPSPVCANKGITATVAGTAATANFTYTKR